MMRRIGAPCLRRSLKMPLKDPSFPLQDPSFAILLLPSSSLLSNLLMASLLYCFNPNQGLKSCFYMSLNGVANLQIRCKKIDLDLNSSQPCVDVHSIVRRRARRSIRRSVPVQFLKPQSALPKLPWTSCSNTSVRPSTS